MYHYNKSTFVSSSPIIRLIHVQRTAARSTSLVYEGLFLPCSRSGSSSSDSPRYSACLSRWCVSILINVSFLLTLLEKYGLFIWLFPPPSTLLNPCVRIRLHRLKMLGRHTETTDKGPSHCTHSRYVIVDQVRSASRLAPAFATETRRPIETTITLLPTRSQPLQFVFWWSW